MTEDFDRDEIMSIIEMGYAPYMAVLDEEERSGMHDERNQDIDEEDE